MKTTENTSIERLARRRAGAKMGWYVHAMVYTAVNLFLFALAATGERQWAIFPALGWGVGLAAHGLAVFFVTGGGGLYQSLLDRERSRLQVQRDPW
ncbi:2TM domain-containing protein [Ramlibacter tataouinensis]|uniref:2TM domain-containing protein n=1 Tax=Ramlibacter tataouinensis TaxID=94132 RepID=UPI0022F40728|nr:2TM domain-containing protein [Ramlibacter tataouinensis]WBY01436.1 2TM domain-containing protein [Ramlibacter tataouinensis]